MKQARGICTKITMPRGCFSMFGLQLLVQSCRPNHPRYKLTIKKGLDYIVISSTTNSTWKIMAARQFGLDNLMHMMASSKFILCILNIKNINLVYMAQI